MSINLKELARISMEESALSDNCDINLLERVMSDHKRLSDKRNKLIRFINSYSDKALFIIDEEDIDVAIINTIVGVVKSCEKTLKSTLYKKFKDTETRGELTFYRKKKLIKLINDGIKWQSVEFVISENINIL